MDPMLKSVMETLEDVSKQLAALNDEPNIAPKGVAEEPTREGPTTRTMSAGDMFELRGKLAGKSQSELMQMFSIQARKSGTGIPFESWANAGGAPMRGAIEQDQELTKLLDTGGASALIRQDLEPLLYALFVKTFPAWERFTKEPANGLVHAYNQITAYGDAQFMTELGTVTDDVTTYAGGMGYNPEQIELQSGLRAIAHKMQKTIFQGNATASGGTANDEYGLYDANSFTGLRQILNLAKAKNVDPADTTYGDMRAQFDWAAREVMDVGGTVNIIWTTPLHEQLRERHPWCAHERGQYGVRSPADCDGPRRLHRDIRHLERRWRIRRWRDGRRLVSARREHHHHSVSRKRWANRP
jgi:hypothetical protein